MLIVGPKPSRLPTTRPVWGQSLDRGTKKKALHLHRQARVGNSAPQDGAQAGSKDHSSHVALSDQLLLMLRIAPFAVTTGPYRQLGPTKGGPNPDACGSDHESRNPELDR